MLVYENVRKTYGDFVALNGVSLQVNKGEVMCLIGPSGSGKSTLLRCTNALEKLDGGRVLLDGAVVPDTEPEVQRVRQRMGMVFQSFELFPHKSALDNVAMGPITVLGMAPEAARTRAMALLEKWAWRPRPATSRPTCPAASSSAWPSPARWRWSPR